VFINLWCALRMCLACLGGVFESCLYLCFSLSYFLGHVHVCFTYVVGLLFSPPVVLIAATNNKK